MPAAGVPGAGSIPVCVTTTASLGNFPVLKKLAFSAIVKGNPVPLDIFCTAWPPT